MVAADARCQDGLVGIAPGHSNVSEALVDVCQQLGVRYAFGLLGGAGVRFYDALNRSKLRLLHFRHESGAVFAAIEAYFATGNVGLAFTTTGPGLYNAVNGIAAARRDGAKLVVVSASTSAAEHGRGAFQETSPYTMAGSELLTSGSLFHYSVTPQDAAELGQIASRLANGLARPHGFVAHVQLPMNLQHAPARRTQIGRRRVFVCAAPSDEAVRRSAELIESGRTLLWLGFGAREAAGDIIALAEKLAAPVIASPRAKGIFPESHPLYVGTTGFGASPHAGDFVASYAPDTVVVLGSRLGEFTSFWDPAFEPRRSFIHVDLDPEVPGAAYPEAPTVAVVAEVGQFVRRLLATVERRDLSWPDLAGPGGVPLSPRTSGPIRPQFLMQQIQRTIVERTDAVVMTEAGSAFAWATDLLRFERPGRYRVSTGFGSMGHAATGVVGAAVALGSKAVAIVGDGALLMNNEINTAVQARIPAVWIVLNDAGFGLVDQGVRKLGFHDFELRIPPVDFAAIARAMGAQGERVTTEPELEAALARAMASDAPFVVDVAIDPAEVAPMAARIRSLERQAGQGEK
jgi:acetolactate synthase-1/2/3 large subunit